MAVKIEVLVRGRRDRTKTILEEMSEGTMGFMGTFAFGLLSALGKFLDILLLGRE